MLCVDKLIFHSMHASREEFGACGTCVVPYTVALGWGMNRGLDAFLPISSSFGLLGFLFFFFFLNMS